MNIYKKFFVLIMFVTLHSLLSATSPVINPKANINNDQALAVFYTVDGDIQTKYNSLVEEKLKGIGFNLTDPHKRVNDQYKKRYGSTVLDILSFMSVVKDEAVLPLLNIDPRIAGFAPFNLLIEKRLDEKVTHVGHLMPKVMLDILGVHDEEVRTKFTETFSSLDEMIEKELGGEKSYTALNTLPEKTMINFEYTFEAVDDIEDFVDEFQEKFEQAFIDKEYLIAGYHNFMESTDDAESVLKDYAAFWTYSLCHLEFSYNMFDNKGARPDAGLFAPCTMYMYIKKGTNKLVIGMLRLQNWTDTLNITDKKRTDLAQSLDKEIPEILTALGMVATENVNPLLASNKSTKKNPVIQKLATAPAKIKSDIPQGTLALFYTLEGDDIENKYNKIIEEDLKGIGFNITDPHKRVNDQYKKRYGATVLDTLSFLSVTNDKIVLPLLNIDPRIASTAPFNMLIHKKLKEKVVHVGHLAPEAFLDMVGIKDQKVRDTFTASFGPLDKKLESLFKENGLTFKKSYLPYKKLPEKTMINFEYTFEAVDDIEDFVDEFQEKFEQAFIDKEYLIAGYHNFMESTDDAESVLKDYAAFWTYSLCHLEFSYNMFDNKGARPDAGLFAPCTMYMYIKKGTNKLIIGMLRLQNWTDTLNITDKKRTDLAQSLDKEIPEILTALGMVATENVNPLNASTAVTKNTKKAPKAEKKTIEKKSHSLPKKETVSAPTAPKKESEEKPADSKKVKIQTIQNGGNSVNIIIPKPPKVPSVIKLNTINGGLDGNTRSIKFSKRIPPNYIPSSQREKEEKATNTSTNIGEVTNGKISAYIRGQYIDEKEAKSKLEDAGFTIISSSAINKKGDLISIVFTNDALTKMASKTNRGFAASLRLLVNKKDNHISITNPLYMAKAFMQDAYDEKIPKEILGKITSTFGNLLNSKDSLKFQLLPKYQFMVGMPEYLDMDTVGSGDNLLKKLKNNKKVVFVQKLANGSTLVGIELGKRTNKFIGRIGTNNAALLPYPMLIEDGKAKILDPKYYISVMYPMLQMSEFMTIATVPGAIIKDCEKVFK